MQWSIKIMSDIKFTKGEWRVSDDFDIYCGAVLVSYVVEGSEDDAHLIAAAPDMYAEIENDIVFFKYLLIDAITDGERNAIQSKINSKNTLLAKARGEQ